MKVVIVRRGRTIAPFGCDVDACGLGAGTFASYRERVLRDEKVSVEEASVDDGVTGPAIVWSDDVFVSKRALEGFASAAAGELSRLCLEPSRLLELFSPLQDVDTHEGKAGYDVGFVPAGQSLRIKDVFALGAERWRAPPYRQLDLEVPVPRHILGRESSTMVFPVTSTVVMRVRHWLHVLRAGHLMPQVALLERASSQPVRSALRGLSALRPTRAGRMRALRRAFSYRGRGTYVHPTATVEASVLGDDVTVGAHSYVTNSVLGDGCVIEQRAHVSGCSLGPRTFVSLNSSLSACVTFGDTDACINGVQACVIAQGCALTSFARPLDLAVGGAVRVEDDGGLREVGELPCGVAFGPKVFVGADVVIAAGRAVPAGVRLYVNADRVLRKVPADLAPGSYAVVDGKPLE